MATVQTRSRLDVSILFLLGFNNALRVQTFQFFEFGIEGKYTGRFAGNFSLHGMKLVTTVIIVEIGCPPVLSVGN